MYLALCGSVNLMECNEPARWIGIWRNVGIRGVEMGCFLRWACL